MRACPINLEPLADGETFSPAGLRSWHPRLTHLQVLALGQDEQLRQARLRADKMSIQGVQPKLSAVLKPKDGCFEVVDCGGRFILKPNPPPYEEVPANEALSMTLARHAGIEVPPHGLLPAVDGSWVYVVRRFDRAGRDDRLHVEDFAQLSGATRDTKYASSLEQVAKLVETHCSFPAVEKAALARRLLFCFLIGNEDMHLKNFSLLVERGKVRLAPAYDFLNSTLVLENASEESALPLRGRKRKLTRADWIDYFCRERLGLPETILAGILADLRDGPPEWEKIIRRSFLSTPRQDHYIEILENRHRRIFR
ncbi:MAG: HipA domain-containing protein [Akkermansiaceae bacterium]|nr:HipA domain-containing protein [Akkermansiaceae bacterium]